MNGATLNATCESAIRVRRLGRYRIFATLGQGGMGSIHLAVTDGFGGFRKLFVIKELHAELAQTPRFVEMFNQEAKLAALLSHAHVVQTYEAERRGDSYYIAMEFLDGRCLMDVMRSPHTVEPVPLPARLRMICDALSGLHYAHECVDYDGTPLLLVHRDVSPQNIFVTYDGQVKLLDFGVAKTIMDLPATQPGLFKGKFGYAAPEQLLGHELDRRADIFAMGVILWENLFSRRFARGKLTAESVSCRISGDEPRAQELAPDMDATLAAICDRALEVRPADRFASADAMRDALQGYLQESGNWVDEGVVAAHMRRCFAAEREAMNALIAAGLQQVERHRPVSVTMFQDALGALNDHGDTTPEAVPAGAIASVVDKELVVEAENEFSAQLIVDGIEVQDVPVLAYRYHYGGLGDSQSGFKALVWDQAGSSVLQQQQRRGLWSFMLGFLALCGALVLIIWALIAPPPKLFALDATKPHDLQPMVLLARLPRPPLPVPVVQVPAQAFVAQDDEGDASLDDMVFEEVTSAAVAVRPRGRGFRARTDSRRRAARMGANAESARRAAAVVRAAGSANRRVGVADAVGQEGGSRKAAQARRQLDLRNPFR